MITNDIILSINRSVGVINTSFKIQKNKTDMAKYLMGIRIQKIKKIWKTGKQ